jgi:GNAT superfamily N-acetyltransferase
MLGFWPGASEIVKIEFHRNALTASEQAVVSEGFREQNEDLDVPEYIRERVKWLAVDELNNTRAALTADILWDWLYVDELWVCPSLRGTGVGRQLMQLAEAFALSRNMCGIWLWTQSWQAEGFYRHLGYHEFTSFENFPRGHSRIGLRKTLI